MHRYASQTPEARELVAELEFVWDQIKSNTSSTSSGSSPLRPVGVPPLSQQTYPYASIGGRLARSSTADYEHMVAVAAGGGRGDSRLRVLSPVSQPDEMYQRHRSELGDDEAVDEELEEDEDEEYAEAQDTLYDDDEDHENRSYEQERDAASASASAADDDVSRGRRPHDPARHPPPPSSSSHHPSDGDNRRWRRRVEQALTKMTAEIAAVREQMEARALAHRRRSSLWAWLKWLVWVTFRQIIWDLAVLSMLLIWMRVRGDRRLEEKLKVGWAEVKTRLAKLKGLRRVPKVYIFP
jgi:hypothetical protein